MIALFVALAVSSVVTALFAVLAWARERWLVVTVVGQSMVPALVDGQRVLARRPQRGQRFAIGDVVVFALPAPLARQARANRDVAYRVKRIAAVTGDPLPAWLARDVSYGARPVAAEGGEPVPGWLARAVTAASRDSTAASRDGTASRAIDRNTQVIGDWRNLSRNARIPEGHFAVIGDAPGSEDSRYLGLVARGQILAWLPCLAYRDVRRRREPAWEEQDPAAPLYEPPPDRIRVWITRKDAEPAVPAHEPAAHCVGDPPNREGVPLEGSDGRAAAREKTIPVACLRLLGRRRSWW
jgi:signal peptidase I